MKSSAVNRINELFQQSIHVHEQSLESLAAKIADTGEILAKRLLDGGKIMTCGNGDSVLEAIGFSTILLNKLDRERPGLPAIALNANASTITAIGGDHHLDQIYARQIHALANQGDVLAVFTTTGQAAEISKSIDAAHQYKLPVVLFSGGDGGQAAQMLEDSDCELRVQTRDNNNIRQIHLLLIHCLCDYIDKEIFNY